MCCDRIREHNVGHMWSGCEKSCNLQNIPDWNRCPLNVRVRSSINAFDVASPALYLGCWWSHERLKPKELEMIILLKRWRAYSEDAFTYDIQWIKFRHSLRLSCFTGLGVDDAAACKQALSSVEMACCRKIGNWSRAISKAEELACRLKARWFLRYSRLFVCKGKKNKNK